MGFSNRKRVTCFVCSVPGQYQEKEAQPACQLCDVNRFANDDDKLPPLSDWHRGGAPRSDFVPDLPGRQIRHAGGPDGTGCCRSVQRGRCHRRFHASRARRVSTNANQVEPRACRACPENTRRIRTELLASSACDQPLCQRRRRQAAALSDWHRGGAPRSDFVPGPARRAISARRARRVLDALPVGSERPVPPPRFHASRARGFLPTRIRSRPRARLCPAGKRPAVRAKTRAPNASPASSQRARPNQSARRAQRVASLQPGSSCSLCGAGLFAALSEQQVCSPCTSDAFRTGEPTGTGMCSDCPKGYSQPTTGQASCLPCPPGKHQALPGQPSCLDCAKDSFTDATAQTSCTNCEIGRYTAAIDSVAASCAIGGAGRFGPGCRDCPLGWHRSEDNPDLSRCVQCRIGQTSAIQGAASCSSCDLGKFAAHARRV